MRLDVLLNRLCLTRSRNEAKTACDAGAVLLSDLPAKASQTVNVGDTVTLLFPTRLLAVQILEIPGKSVSKKAARDMYQVMRDEPIDKP